MDEWITLKVVITDAKGVLYLNAGESPVLIVENLKLGASAKGAIGLFVDIGTEAFFKDLKVTITN